MWDTEYFQINQNIRPQIMAPVTKPQTYKTYICSREPTQYKVLWQRTQIHNYILNLYKGNVIAKIITIYVDIDKNFIYSRIY